MYFFIFVLLSASQANCYQARSTSSQTLLGHWGSWSSWSTCTNEKEVGTRERSRLCNGGSCHHLSGENHELQLCSQKTLGLRSQKKSFLDKCKYDPQMNSTLSCKLYLENPTMAYNIFKTTNCLFDSTAFRADSDNSDKFLYESLLSRIATTRLHDLHNTPKHPSRSSKVQHSERKKRIHRFCKHTCDRLVLQALGVTSHPSPSLPSLGGLLNRLRKNAIQDRDRVAISLERASCLKSCRSSGGDYRVLVKKLLNRDLDLSQESPKLCSNLHKNLVSKEAYKDSKDLRRNRRDTSSSSSGDLILRPMLLTRKQTEMVVKEALYRRRPGASRKISRKEKLRFDKILSSNPTPEQLQHIMVILQEDAKSKRLSTDRSGSVTSLSQTTITKEEENVTITRSKRQAPESMFNPKRYKSPCFEITDFSTNPNVVDFDNTSGELFFFEGRQQRFMRRRCAGSVIVPGTLFRPRESVTQTRTGQLALCKQGYLKRYGLIIQLDPTGVFSFNNGERFSVKFKPFKLESHCALSTLE